MKRIFFVCTLNLLFFLGFSQGPGRLGFFAGPQVTSTMYTIENQKQPPESKIGFHAGMIFKVPFDRKLFFAPSIYYSLKGYKVKLNNPSFPPSTLAKDNNTTIHTMEIAPYLQYDFSEEAAHFFVRLGPTVDFAFSGKEEFTLQNDSLVSQPMKFSFVDYGRFTAAAMIQFGYETGSGFMIYGHYSHGAGSMNNADGGPKIRHRIFGISLGKFFN